MNYFDTVITKFYDGEPLSDSEIDFLVDRMTEVVESTVVCGLLFKTALSEAISIRDRVISMHNARNKK